MSSIIFLNISRNNGVQTYLETSYFMHNSSTNEHRKRTRSRMMALTFQDLIVYYALIKISLISNLVEI